jgi:glycosyltransferase involved in cell wall biosynthesis
MTPPPRVSVIVPFYNLGRYLDEAVDSVLAQSFQDLEIIVVDDGSTDEATRLLLADYERPRTRVLRVPHGGLARARNLGIAQAAGEYLCALDADDRIEPSFLTKAVEVLDRDPSLAFVSAWLSTFGDETWEWTPASCGLPELLWENTVLTAALVRRSVVRDVGGYDEGMPVQGDEDWDLWLGLVERGYRGVILPEVLFRYRRRAGSMSTICWHGPGHLPLAQYRIAKHAAAYQRHLTEVLLHQDRDTAELLRRNDELEQCIAAELEPELAGRREELARLRSRLEQSDRLVRLESALAAASNEVSALRSSMSWRVTAPLRQVYGWFMKSSRSS